MTSLQLSVFGQRLPTAVEQADASRLRQIMSKTRAPNGAFRFVFGLAENGPQETYIDEALGETLLAFLEIVEKGQAVQIVPIEAELSTKQAAGLLNVSRPHLIKLLNEGKMEFRKVGSHRRVRASELFEYKRKQEELRAKALEEMIREVEGDDLL